MKNKIARLVAVAAAGLCVASCGASQRKIEFDELVAVDCHGDYPALDARFRDTYRNQDLRIQYFWRGAGEHLQVRVNNVGPNNTALSFAPGQKEDFQNIAYSVLEYARSQCPVRETLTQNTIPNVGRAP